MSDVTIVIKAQNQAQAAMQAVKGDLEQIGRTAGGLKQQLANAAAEMRNIGMGLTAGVTLPVVGIAAAAVNSAAQFEQSLNVMQQVSGATEAQMASMQAQALQLGAETAFSAGEAAAGMLELAKAGLDTDQVMAAIGGTMDLAAAGNLGLAQAAEIAANAVNTFGLDATETVDVANMLAAAANASSVEVTDLAAGMQMAGSVFASSGQGIDDLTTALALMGNAGIKGSDAGTSLKTMLMRLTAPTKEAAGVMDQLNVSMYNLDGSTRDLPDVLADIQAATAGMTDETRTMALTTLFGADAIRAVNVLMAEGEEGWAAMAEAVGAQGAATEVANARMSGMAGAIEYIKGSIDSFLIGSALPFLDTMGGIVRQAADAITWFGALDPAVKNAAIAFGAVLAAAGPVLLALSGIATAIGFLLSPIGLVVVGLAALAAAWTMNFGGIQEITAQAFATVQPYLQAAYDWLMAQIPGALTTLQAAWDTTWAALSTAASTAWSIIQPYLQAAYDWFQTNGPGALTTLQTAWDATWAALQTAVDTTWAVIGPYLQGALTWFQTDGPAALTTMQTAWDTTWAALQTAVSNAWAIVGPYLDSALTWFQTDGPAALTTMQTAWDTTWNSLSETATAIWTQLEALFGPAVGRLKEAFGTMGTQVAGLAPHFEGLQEAIGAFWTAIQPVLQMFGTLIAGVMAVVGVLGVNLLAQAFNSFGAVVGTVIDQITLTLNTIGTVLTEVVTLVTAIVNGDWAAAFASAEAIVLAFKTYFEETFNNFLELVTEVFTGIATAITDTLTDLGVDTEGIMTGISTWWESVWSGLTEKIQPVIDMIAEFRKTLEGFASWVSGFSIPNPFAGWSMPTMPAIPGWPGAPAQNQLGTSYYDGGPTWVGEAGRELLVPPRGSQIVPNRAAEKLAGAVDRVAVTVQQMIVRDDKDVYALAYQVADILARG